MGFVDVAVIGDGGEFSTFPLHNNRRIHNAEYTPPPPSVIHANTQSGEAKIENPSVFEKVNLKYPQETKDLITVIVPVYNAAKYLRKALDSVLAQTYQNWECVLVDDGSTDGCQNICDEYAAKDARFNVIHKKNSGTMQARKTGLENSKGEYIANLDSDDSYHPQFLEKMLAKIKETNSDFVWCIFDRYKKGHPYYVTDYKWSKKPEKNIKSIYASGKCFLWNKLIKRSVYSLIEYPTINVTPGEDWIQILQIVYYTSSAVFVDEDLYHHFLGSETSVMRTFNTINKEKKLEQFFLSDFAVFKILKKFFGENEEMQSIIMERINCLKEYYLLLPQRLFKEYEYLNVLQIAPESIKYSRLRSRIPLYFASKGFLRSARLMKKAKEEIHLWLRRAKSVVKKLAIELGTRN